MVPTESYSCRDELVVYLCFSSHIIYFALLLCVEHCFTEIKFYTTCTVYILKRAKYHPSLLQFSSRLNCTEAAGSFSKTQSIERLEALDLFTFDSFAVNDRDINFMCTSSLAAVHSNISIFFPGDAFRLTWTAKYVVQYQPLKEASI